MYCNQLAAQEHDNPKDHKTRQDDRSDSLNVNLLIEMQLLRNELTAREHA